MQQLSSLQHGLPASRTLSRTWHPRRCFITADSNHSCLLFGIETAAPHFSQTKQEVNLQNANAWADLGNAKAEEKAADAPTEGDGEDGLWDEFKSREQEEEQRVHKLAC